MRCPTHGLTVAANEYHDVEIACPECREVWSARGDLYELPGRDENHERPPQRRS
jgi:Zn-finger nucleic acid-binding protein